MKGSNIAFVFILTVNSLAAIFLHHVLWIFQKGSSEYVYMATNTFRNKKEWCLFLLLAKGWTLPED